MNELQLESHLKALRDEPAFQNLRDQLNGFDPFKVLKVERYELRHTTTLAWLLDPQQTHRLGSRFLECFLSEVFGVHAEDILGAEWNTGLENRVAVHSELRLSGGKMRTQVSLEDQSGRVGKKARNTGELDVLIESETWAVAIEAKIDSDEGQDQLRDYRDSLTRRFAGRKRLFLLYLTVQDDPEVIENNPGWIGIQWGQQVADALEASLTSKYGANLERDLEQCPADECPLHDFLLRYRALLQRLAKTMHGLTDVVQPLADRHYESLAALKTGLRELEDANTTVLPWMSSPAWARQYWTDRQAFDVLVEHARSPQARFVDEVLTRLFEKAGAPMTRLSSEGSKDATVRFIPEHWRHWQIPDGDSLVPLHSLMFYHAALRSKDIEIKLYLPKVANRALQRQLAREMIDARDRIEGNCIEPDPKFLARYLDGGDTLKLYTMSLYWLGNESSFRLKDDEDLKFGELEHVLAGHRKVLEFVMAQSASPQVSIPTHVPVDQ